MTMTRNLYNELSETFLSLIDYHNGRNCFGFKGNTGDLSCFYNMLYNIAIDMSNRKCAANIFDNNLMMFMKSMLTGYIYKFYFFARYAEEKKYIEDFIYLIKHYLFLRREVQKLKKTLQFIQFFFTY